MRSIVIPYCYFLFTCLFIAGCRDRTQQGTPHITGSEDPVGEVRDLCYRNEYPFKDQPGQKDVAELFLTIRGNKVSGVYNWLPAMKDQRKGTFRGKLYNDSIKGQYLFKQEGMADSVELKILIGEKKAIVSGGDPSLGLSATLKEVPCGKN